jgi:hypothetical protein
MTPVEIIALILAIAVIVKILVVSFSPKTWLNAVAKPLYKNPVLLVIVELLLAGVVFYYLLQELTVVQIVACTFFGALLTGMTFAVYSKETLSLAEKMLRSKLLKKAWLPILVWLALAIWALKEIFY